MQMQTTLELLKLRLEGEVGQWVKQGSDTLAVRQKVRDQIMSAFPNLYSWVNRKEDDTIKVEVFDRTSASSAIIELSFKPSKNRP